MSNNIENENMEEKSDKNKPNRPDVLLRFYKSYFIDYWEVKYKRLKYEIDNFETQKERLNEISGLDSVPNYEKKYLSMLKFDLHFMKFQIIETLFSFIFALENGDDMILWFNLSFPKESSERSFAAYDKISGLSKRGEMEKYLKKEIEINNESIPLWQYFFFFNVNFTQINKDLDIVENNIITILNQMASIFADRDDYNAYKHTLRCLPTSLAMRIKSNKAGDYIPFGYAKEGLEYLTKKEKNDDIIINKTFKAFSINEDAYYIENAIDLLKNLLNSRISYFFNEELGDISFFEKLIPFLQEDYTIQSFSRSITSLNILFMAGISLIKGRSDYKNAIPFFERILQIKSSHYESIFELGFCYFSLEDYERAIPYFQKYVKNNVAEHWKEGIFNLSVCHFEKNDYEEAKRKLNQFFKSFSDKNDDITRSARFLLADVLLNLNQQYFSRFGRNKSNYIKRAEKLLNETEKRGFDHPEEWLKLALVKDFLKNYDDCKVIYKKIIEHSPNILDAILKLGRIYFMEGNDNKIEELIEQVLQVNNENPNTWTAIASLKEKQGKMEEFHEACKNSLKYSSNDEEKKHALYNLGAFFMTSEDYPKAIDFFKQSLAIDETFDHALNGLHQCLYQLERYDEIIEMTEDIDLNLDNLIIFRLRALAFFKIGEVAESMEITHNLMSLDESDNELQCYLNIDIGDIYKIRENWEKSIEFYQKALQFIQDVNELTSEIEEKINEAKKNLNQKDME